MRRFACKVLGHNWGGRYDIVIGEKVIGQIRFCRRCGFYESLIGGQR